jgi:tagatose 1,6-diphosphate aldolase GatY/KbaY
MKMQEKFAELRSKKKALLATNFYNLETLKGVLKAAEELQQPIILQLTESSIQYIGLENSIALARAALKSSKVEGWIHLDHGGSFELAERCLSAGVDSVMIDGSELSFEKNVELTRRVVKIAKNFGANVEAELGYVAKLGQSNDKMEYTSPSDAKAFVDETGVDTLAVAIGTAHGFYKSEPKLDFERLAQIREATSAGLVLHGGSGVPDAQLVKSIQNGIVKINLATEIKNIFMLTLKELMSKSDEIDLRKVFPPATKAVTDLVKQKLAVIAGFHINGK